MLQPFKCTIRHLSSPISQRPSSELLPTSHTYAKEAVQLEAAFQNFKNVWRDILGLHHIKATFFI